MNVHSDLKEMLVKKFKIVVFVILSILFILYGMGFMMYRGISKTLLDQQYYHTVVDNYGIPSIVHEALKDMIPPIVRDGLTGGSPVTDPQQKAAVDMQEELISKAITDSLHEAWIEEQVVMVTDDVVGLLTKEAASLSAVIELKGKLNEIENAIAAGLEKLTDAELYAMFGAPREYIPMIAEKIVGTLGLPESLIIGDLAEEMAPGTLDMVGGYLGTLHTIFGIIAWVVFLAFLVICMLFWKIGRGLQWFGVSAALAGGAFLGLTSYFLNLGTIESMTGVDIGSLPIDSSTIKNIIRFTFSEMKLMPLLFLVGGVVLFSLGIVLHRVNSRAH